MNEQSFDNTELEEWRQALLAVVKRSGKDIATELLQQILHYATQIGVDCNRLVNTSYCNTISVADTPVYPGDLNLESEIEGLIRWNAMIMVHRTNQVDSSLGGHISTYSSSSTLYEIGFNHFFRGYNNSELGDLIYYQGHSSPGIYARSFVEQRLTQNQLENFRREVGNAGLSSYPHPHLMPEYWQFPTVSMGLGPISAIYTARYLKYLDNRNILAAGNRKVWAFLGDGECSEPESLGCLPVACVEKLDNLIFVINCNLQRLDGLVRGNAKIIQELEAVFLGCGWNVIKVIWGSNWDSLFAKDSNGLLQQRLNAMCDGDFQNCKAKGGAYTRECIFGGHPELQAMVADWSDDDIAKLNRGGHDPHKVYAAYKKATMSVGKPTVILAKTIKGYGLGSESSSANIAHNVKKLATDAMREYRDEHCTSITDNQLENQEFVQPEKGSLVYSYLHDRRQQLNGYLPVNQEQNETLQFPNVAVHKRLLAGTGSKEASTTMGFVNILSTLCKDSNMGELVVPIVPDEARTFGMEGLFKQLGIYSPIGQKYVPHDEKKMMPYIESIDGQLLEEGINEAGSFSSWIAAATSYRHSLKTTIPFYIYYSMFGFQRVGDLAWLAGDSGAKGFLIGATSGRTTLNGEGLQHQDGHSHIQAGLIPNCISYDPTYNYELAVIIHHGLNVMYRQNKHCFFYITTTNENYPQPQVQLTAEMTEGIQKGLYLMQKAQSNADKAVNLFGSGTILREVEAAAAILKQQFAIDSNIWSMTSGNLLYNDALAVERHNQLHPEKTAKHSFLQNQLKDYHGSVVIATDYIKRYAEQLRQFIANPLLTLGTDGYGRSDSRKKLRYFFEVDRNYIAYYAALSLYKEGQLAQSKLIEIRQSLAIDPAKPIPTEV